MTTYMDVTEFREAGYLQELNRQFLHPLGLALEVRINDDGSESFGGIWDCREDEGLAFGDTTDQVFVDNAVRIIEIQKTYEKEMGRTMQPLFEVLDEHD